MGREVTDAGLIETKALPAADGSVSTTAFNLLSSKQDFTAPLEIHISAPVLTTTELPNADTMDYKVEDSADNSSFATVYDKVIAQLGAGGAGAAADTARVALPTDIRQYVRVTATGAGTIGDCSGKSMTVEMRF